MYDIIRWTHTRQVFPKVRLGNGVIVVTTLLHTLLWVFIYVQLSYFVNLINF